jgi:hypothetical protein
MPYRLNTVQKSNKKIVERGKIDTAMYMIDHFPGFGIFTFMAPHCKIYLFQSVIFLKM